MISLRSIAPATRLWILAGLAFAIRIAAGLATGRLLNPELFEYDSAARALVSGQGYVYYHIGIPYYSYMAPLHSWLGAASYWLTGSTLLVMLLQCAAGAAIAPAAAAISRRLTSDRLAEWIAGLLVAVHPGLIVYSAMKGHPLVFDALAFTLTLLLVMRLSEVPALTRALLLGLMVGVGALSRGTIVIFLPIAGLWLLWTATGETRSRAFGLAVAAGLTAAVIIAPWTIRSSLKHGAFVFILTTDAEDFWRGNNPYATGHSYIDADHIVLTAIPPEELADLQAQPDEMAQARWFSTRARAFIREHPDQFVRLTALKFYQFWWFAKQSGMLYPRSWLWIYKAYYSALLVCAALGAWYSWRSSMMSRRALVLLIAFLFALSALQSLYYVEGRHRWAVEPMLIAITAVGVTTLLGRRGARGAALPLANGVA